MKLEEEIKQTKPFKSEYERLLVNIQFTASWMNGTFSKMLKPYGITPHQYNMLRILKGKYPEGYSNREITERMVDKSSNATRIADKLLDKKLITRKSHPGDRRQVDILISKKGLDLISEIDASNHLMIEKSKAFKPENAKQMNQWLDELRKD